nr:hypothetical protein [Tanacetum cinerariifolium]
MLSKIPEYLVLVNNSAFKGLVEEQPLSDTVSPNTDSPGYINESNSEKDPKEDDEDPKEDPADYPTNKDDDEKEETDFVTTVRQDTDKICGRLDNANDDRLLMSSQVNSLRRDTRSHARTVRLMKSEARASSEAWMEALQSQQRPARDPTHPDVPEETGSSS